MRIFQDVIMNSYYWNDEKIKYLHEKVIKNNIGIYKGFYQDYGQALRINFLDMLLSKEIIKQIKDRKVKIKDIEKTIYQEKATKYSDRVIKYFMRILKRKAFFDNALDGKLIRAG